jgi:hypothetical protein
VTTQRTIELVAAVLLLVAGGFFYRRRDPADEGYGGQGAVILFVLGVIVAIHALGLMQYRPSKAETDMLRSQNQ